MRSGFYRPRDPCASPLWQCAVRPGKELREGGQLQRAVEVQVIERFNECGDPITALPAIYCEAQRTRLPARVLVQDPLFLSELPPEGVLLYGEFTADVSTADVSLREVRAVPCRSGSVRCESLRRTV